MYVCSWLDCVTSEPPDSIYSTALERSKQASVRHPTAAKAHCMQHMKAVLTLLVAHDGGRERSSKESTSARSLRPCLRPLVPLALNGSYFGLRASLWPLWRSGVCHDDSPTATIPEDMRRGSAWPVQIQAISCVTFSQLPLQYAKVACVLDVVHTLGEACRAQQYRSKCHLLAQDYTRTRERQLKSRYAGCQSQAKLCPTSYVCPLLWNDVHVGETASVD